MTDDHRGEGTPQQGQHGGWERLPQGDYDDGATTFVQLPEGGIDALLASDSPLAAPGHGYVPPQITVTPAEGAGTDPAAPGTWTAPAEGAQWPDPNAVPQGTETHGFTYDPPNTGQWTFGDVPQEQAGPGSAPGHDVTGQWSIPVAGGDIPDESGEFSASSLVEQWGGTPPATLPGGAPAPWATEAIGTAWTAPPPERTEERTLGGSIEGHAPEVLAGAVDLHGPAVPVEAPAAEAPDAPSEAHGEPPRDRYAGSPAEAASEAPEAAHEASGQTDGVSPESPGLPEEEPAGDTPDAAPAAEGAEDAEDAPAEAPAPLLDDDHPLASYVLRVNGTERPVPDAWIGESLLYVLRERLGLAGAKDGCSQGECGACNVQVDGRLVASCLVPAVTAAGSEVRTVEGLAADGQPSDVQRALARCGAVQCGFCVPGMAMTVHDLLEGNPAPTELETRAALCGNLCRCSGYRGVVEAVREVVAEREAHTKAESAPEPEEARIPHQAGPGAGGVNPAAFEDPSGYDIQGRPPGQHDQGYGPDGGGQA
ncbi:2Fe-2S iron-sulfur cluster-binding protein [Streptomyces spongiae]|uniref:2Fe-2S iron-sulfur cluster binding domain-containing protein n=1 Tax=Streptomyces spongiae TaxID=565072 RepID=A0A5N8XBY5_9ACTN|nr:2Fe-2S iron-sulfur cluster-binding protein [Streptomyces spongiae]MPY56959.1 2Fe-2S iron-sulfur cluster binding domain-containing protein [Streptomyces spongiae]